MTDAHRLPGCERELNHLSARAETRTAFGLTALAVAAAALVAAACSSEPAESTLQPKSAPSEAAAGHAVIGKAPPAIGSFPSVIILEPHAPGDFPVPREPAVMDQYGRAFFPSTLLVREGQPVEFRNSEAEPHNVHVADTSTGSTVINVGMPFLGSFDHTFEKAGAYAVSCDVHPGMTAVILVTSTPYAVVANNDGSFSLSDVPPGSYDFTVRAGARRIRRVVEIEGPQTELILDEN